MRVSCLVSFLEENGIRGVRAVLRKVAPYFVRIAKVALAR